MAKVRILHLSDLHERGPRETEGWRRRRVLGDAWARNLDELCAGGAPDLVCFTGDAADWGLPAEYERATEFFQALLARLGVPSDRFFTVPGNHDIQRRVAGAAWRKLRKDLPRVSPLDVSRWLLGGPPPPGFRDGQRDAVLARGAAYRDWVAKGMGRADLLPDPKLHRHLGYRRTLRLPGHGFDIQVVGLDSAWLCGDENDSGRLRLTEDQVMRLTTDAAGANLPGFRLVLVHHPLDDLADGADCRRLLAERADLLLRGHLHEAEPNLWADPQRSLHQVAAGCLYEGHHADRHLNACAVIDVELDAAGRPQGYEIRFRGWSPRGGHWHDDNSLYQGCRDGRLRLRIGPVARRPAAHPRVHDVFVGRQRELAQLAQALLPAQGLPRPAAVQGMPGVGKSYLVDRFHGEHRQHFPGGYVRLALDPRRGATRLELLGRLADLLELPSGGDALAERIRERLLGPRTLLHVENVDARSAAEPVAELLRDLDGAAVAVTGRLQGLGAAAGWAQVAVARFNSDTACAQLAAETGPAAGAAADLRRLAQELGGLPLAIHLAAGHLRHGRSVDGFLDLLRRKGLALPLADPADPLLDDPDRAVLATTFALSLDLLREQLGADGGGAGRRLPLPGPCPGGRLRAEPRRLPGRSRSRGLRGSARRGPGPVPAGAGGRPSCDDKALAGPFPARGAAAPPCGFWHCDGADDRLVPRPPSRSGVGAVVRDPRRDGGNGRLAG